jgi:hypothetical protein
MVCDVLNQWCVCGCVCHTGLMEGSLTQRVAYTLTTDFLAHADFIATVHSGGDSGAFQIAPVAGFLSPPAAATADSESGAPGDDKASTSAEAPRRAQQQRTCGECAMSAGVWAVDSGSGSVQETAENLGVPSVFVAAAGALGGGAHGSNHDALGLVRNGRLLSSFVPFAVCQKRQFAKARSGQA